MGMSIASPPGEIIPRIRQAVEASIPGAQVEVSSNGNHFEIRVVSAEFDGKRTLARQRMVLQSIAHLMNGDNPPVHAIDRLETLVPEPA
jgi:acid stress-induced BolA-like protein IbaG/YrbA